MIILDGNQMIGRRQIHDELRQKLSLPDYYGNNLDALNDCLGERTERELIVIQSAGAFLQRSGEYGWTLLKLLNDNGLQVLLD